MPNRLLTLPPEICREIYKLVFKRTLKELKYRTKTIFEIIAEDEPNVYDYHIHSDKSSLRWEITHKNPKSKRHRWEIKGFVDYEKQTFYKG